VTDTDHELNPPLPPKGGLIKLRCVFHFKKLGCVVGFPEVFPVGTPTHRFRLRKTHTPHNTSPKHRQKHTFPPPKNEVPHLSRREDPRRLRGSRGVLGERGVFVKSVGNHIGGNVGGMVGVVGVGGTTRRFYVQKVPPLHPNPNHNHNHNHKRHVNLTPLPHNREHVWGWDVPKVPVEVVLGRGHPLPGPISP
jgi:hypothetical protein